MFEYTKQIGVMLIFLIIAEQLYTIFYDDIHSITAIKKPKNKITRNKSRVYFTDYPTTISLTTTPLTTPYDQKSKLFFLPRFSLA